MFELRTYVANPGKMEQLVNRFRDHTIALFSDHNVETIGFWIDATEKDTLHYLVKHTGEPSENWANFLKDPRWAQLLEDTEQDGKLAASMARTYMSATEFSGLK